MTPPPSLKRRLSAAALMAAALSAAGCATAPSHPVATPEPAPVAAQVPPPVVTMAPIPNPEAPKSQRVEHAASSAAHSAKRGAQHTTAGAAATAAPTPAPGAPPQPNPQQAARLRAAGLEQLNRGSIDRAVALLRQASQLDPTNELIKRDLDRATRIGRAVHAKR